MGHGLHWTADALIPVLIREKDYAKSEPATLGLVDALKTTFRNRPFLIYLAGNVTFWLGFNIVTLNIPAYVTVLLGGTEGDTAIYFGLVLAVALICFPLVNLFSKRSGLKAVMLFSLLLFALLLPYHFLGQPLVGSPQVFGYVLMALFGICRRSSSSLMPSSPRCQTEEALGTTSRGHARCQGSSQAGARPVDGNHGWSSRFLRQTAGSRSNTVDRPSRALFTIIGAIIFFFTLSRKLCHATEGCWQHALHLMSQSGTDRAANYSTGR